MNSQLKQWPCQIKLIDPAHAAFDNNKLLIAADCAAYAYADFHKDFMQDNVTVIGCPKLDDVNYAIKLKEIIERNNITEITVVRMEVPCCGGISYAVETALKEIDKDIPLSTHVISVGGELLE
ncbi:hypothetical protein [Mycoplasma sp. P36-A1]|uniref:hypothetical protein n=1 Tax=Mycoplasma sp. P36-A1 TaxID=3252900 RepID=UPI003C2F002A